ncbi:MAG: sulfotransferase family protein, partial [Rhodospirillaceae bacterium]
AFIDRLIARFDSAFFAAQSGLGMPDDVKTSEVPVLVVGLPRSGTTLVEQIIASHSRAAGAGELTHFARLEKEAIHLGTGGVLSGLVYPDQADRLDPAALADRARGYLDHLEKIGNGALRVVDKLPANYLRIGLFARLFPRGRIVHTRRSLMDSCLSIYFKNFNASHPYAHDLTHLGRYARSYERLMDHWRKTCPIEILDVDYADMVQDQAGQSKRLLAYLGLPWEDGVLDFHQTDRQVVTASAWQVRRPIYRDALDRSARYGSGPDPLRQALAG